MVIMEGKIVKNIYHDEYVIVETIHLHQVMVIF